MKQHSSIHLLLQAALALLATACVNSDLELPQPPAGDAVNFRTETLDDFATRAAGHTTNGVTAIRSMGIYAGYTQDVWDGTTVANNFFDNLAVSRTSASTAWTYDNEKMWPGIGKLSFFGYAPHSTNIVYGANPPVITVPSAGTPTLQYTIAATHDQQVDLLLATPLFNQTKRDYLTIPMRHALTKIAFSARVANPPSAGTDIRVTKVVVSNLFDKGIIKMDGTNRQWTLDTTSKGVYTQTIVNGGINAVPLSDVYHPLTPADGHLFVMPQTLTEGDQTAGGATVSVTYETKIGTNPAEEKTFELELSRAIAKFDPGMAYNLMFLIDNGVTFIVVPTAWNDTEVQADVKNRILNVSRIEAGVYDGALTRIHFWSNQPRDSVYVLAKGNLDNSLYPTGAEFNVNQVYQNLSGTATAGANIVYPGFTGTTASGEGYIDVVHAADYTGNALRHIWLNASGLTRNIRLNSLFAATPSNTPYIGTFHRWNERGERIIAWESTSLAADEKWTATILDPTDKGADVLIDRFPSPFFGHAITPLYTTNPAAIAAGNPELALLTPSAPHVTSVEGMGKRIYLRVGWNSTVANRTEVRYACIRITKNSDGSTLSTLYLRQGEEADFVMRPLEPGSSMVSRKNAMKFVPFNLTHTGLLSGTSPLAQINTERKNVSFTQYPTQAGALFQWANSTTSRYAYSPITPEGVPATWNTMDVVSDFWAAVKNDHETCPLGYRRPGDGSITSNSDNTTTSSEVRQSLYVVPQDGPDAVPVISDNSLWGFYADGYFDRHKIVDARKGSTQTAVSADDNRVAYAGRLFYNPSTDASIFFPATGTRKGETGSGVNSGELNGSGIFADYWTSAQPGATVGYTGDIRSALVIDNMFTAVRPVSPTYANPIRCVRDLIFTTTLPPYDETGVPTALGFTATADAGATPPVYVDASFLAKWNSVMARDFRLYTETDPATNITVIRKITAKVTFRGITTTGTQAIDTDVFATSLGKDNSSVTYVLNHTALSWTTGTVFTFKVHEGWTARRYLGTSTLVDTTIGGTVVGSADTPTPTISLAGKGCIVFTRTPAPKVP